MGQIRSHDPVKLVVGLIFKDEISLRKALALLKLKFGQIDFESQIIPFNYTDYYKEEFGSTLNRVFVSFKKLIFAKDISRIKIITNKLEQKLSSQNRRTVNIDPGYLNLAKLVLASTKDFSHRIYLNHGIYAEITLIFKDKTFQFLDWTYPDYRAKEYIEIFMKIREIYFHQIKK